MTVKELREKLSNLNDSSHVVVYWEDGKDDQFFGIDDVSLQRGTPMRDAKGKAGFTFDNKGPATWTFVSISPD